jgi:hypothetical protein
MEAMTAAQVARLAGSPAQAALVRTATGEIIFYPAAGHRYGLGDEVLCSREELVMLAQTTRTRLANDLWRCHLLAEELTILGRAAVVFHHACR